MRFRNRDADLSEIGVPDVDLALDAGDEEITIAFLLSRS